MIGMTSTRIVTLQGTPHIISVSPDITERKRAEEERETMLLWQEGVSLLQRSPLAPVPLDQKLKSAPTLSFGLRRLGRC